MDEHLIPPNRPLLVSATLLMAALAGCEGSGSKVKDPVVPPPPRRISMDDTPDPRRSKGDDSDETAVASTDGWKQMGKSKDVKLSGGAVGSQDEVAVASVGMPLSKGEVAAIVNGRPIFYDDVAVRATPQLKQAKAQLSPVEYRKFRRMVVEKYLEPYIERELLLQALRRKLKPEQFDSLQKGLNKQVDEDLKQEMERLGVSSIGELEVELRKSDLSVEAMRTMIRNQKMAEQFLASRAIPRDGFDRPDLVAFYQENLDKYRIEARVRWQQIQLTYSKNGGPKKTEELAKQLIAQLKSGVSFDELAKKHSDGINSDKGGVRDWTTQGSLAAEEVDKLLFELPIDGISGPMKIKDSIWIVKVMDRDEARHKPFEEVQNEIKEDLRKARFANSVKDILKELRDQSTIWLFPEDGN